MSLAAAQDDENSKEQSNNEEARLLEQQLRNFMQASSQQQQQQQGNSANAEAADVGQVVQRLLNNNNNEDDKASPFPNDSDDEDEDGIFLDPEVYARSRELLGPDGSLRLSNNDNNPPSQSWEGQSSSFSTPASVAGVDPTRKAVMNDFLQSFSSQSGSSFPPTPTQRQGQPDATMDDLLQAMKAQQLKLETNSTTTLAEEEELHRRVLAEEEGFQQQSQLFRESLTDASKSAQASELRHGQAFRRRQEAARQSLEAELAAFEAELAQRHVEHPCQKCGCELTQDEIQHAAATGAPAVCRICLSEDIYRTSKLGDKKQTRVPNNVMYPSKYASPQSNARYASSEASARPVPRPLAAPQEPSVAASQRPASRIPATTQQQRPQRPDQSASTPYRERPSVEQGSSSARPSALQQFIQEQQSQSAAGTEKSSNQKEDATQNNENQEWEKMEDPDTGETFYWNTRTNEMRY